MEEQPGQDLVQRKSGELTPWNAADIIAVVIDALSMKGIPLAPMHKGMIAKHAKLLLEAGFEHTTIAMGAMIAIRRGEPHRLQWIVQDLVNAKSGVYLTREEYQRELAEAMERRRWREGRKDD